MTAPPLGKGAFGDPPAPATREAWSGDRPYYDSAGSLCDYVNGVRQRAEAHERYRGYPGQGRYHARRTWPLRFTRDPVLDAAGQIEAERLARGGLPSGRAVVDSSWRKPVWVDGVDTEQFQLAARDQPGDWDPGRTFTGRAALIETNGACRQALFHHDPGGEGPVLRRIGCGAAMVADGRSRWWVVLLRP